VGELPTTVNSHEISRIGKASLRYNSVTLEIGGYSDDSTFFQMGHLGLILGAVGLGGCIRNLDPAAESFK
jgi:hypothetical protein